MVNRNHKYSDNRYLNNNLSPILLEKIKSIGLFLKDITDYVQ